MKKACTSLLLVIIMLMLSAPAYAASSTISVSGTHDISEFGNNSAITINPGLTVELTNTTNTTYFNTAIVCGAGATLTLNGVKIDDHLNDNVCPLSFTGTGNVLILEGESVLAAGESQPGVRVESGTSLEIYGAGMLETTGGNNGAGIGGGYSGDSGTVIIEGGTVIVQGGNNASGIGGGYSGDGGIITIEGGTVTAQGGNYGAGIGGGGYYNDGGIITIKGGEIIAYGGNNGAGIGGGWYGPSGTITIEGGNVTSTGGNNGAGIGGGYSRAGGPITIEGGTVTAQGGSYGAGIGGGNRGAGGNVALSGGVIYTIRGYDAPYDIGNGSGVTGGTLEISGDATVFLRTDTCTAPATSHTHETITQVTDGKVYGVSANGWEPNFGVYVALCTLSYDANGGTGAIPDVIQLKNTTITVSDAAGISRPPYTFGGWNTAADGSGADYPAGSTFTFTGSTTLYAVWNEIRVSGLSLSSHSQTLNVGEGVTFTATVTPANATYPAVTWKSSDESVATVDQNGKVKAVGIGAATIIAKADGEFDICTVLVKAGTPAPESTSTPAPEPAPESSAKPADLADIPITLPEGAAAIQLPNGEIISYKDLDGTVKLQINIDDLNEDGELEFIALDSEGIPVGAFAIRITDETRQVLSLDAADGVNNIFNTVLWIVIGIAGAGVVAAILYILLRKRNRRSGHSF